MTCAPNSYLHEWNSNLHRKGSHSFRFRAIGIDIDTTAIRVFSDFHYCLSYGFPHQKWFSFTTLPKTNYGIWRCLQMRNSKFNDFFSSWTESETVLSRMNGFFLGWKEMQPMQLALHAGLTGTGHSQRPSERFLAAGQ